jgi:predicted Zn-dependent peptidase
MMWVGEHLLAYSHIHRPDEIERRLAAVTGEEIQATAADVFRDHRLNAAVITPAKDEARISELLRFA